MIALWLSCVVLLSPISSLTPPGQAADPSGPARIGGKLVYGLTLSPSGIDPQVNASSELGIVLSSVYDPLVWETSAGQFIPGLASSWDISPDSLTYTFHLRQDVTFHDGTPMDAAAVKFNLDRNRNDPRSNLKVDLINITAVDVTGPLQLKLTMKQPDAALLPTFDVGNIPTEPLLFQAGYLTH